MRVFFRALVDPRSIRNFRIPLSSRPQGDGDGQSDLAAGLPSSLLLPRRRHGARPGKARPGRRRRGLASSRVWWLYGQASPCVGAALVLGAAAWRRSGLAASRTAAVAAARVSAARRASQWRSVPWRDGQFWSMATRAAAARVGGYCLPSGDGGYHQPWALAVALGHGNGLERGVDASLGPSGFRVKSLFFLQSVLFDRAIGGFRTSSSKDNKDWRIWRSLDTLSGLGPVMYTRNIGITSFIGVSRSSIFVHTLGHVCIKIFKGVNICGECHDVIGGTACGEGGSWMC